MPNEINFRFSLRNGDSRVVDANKWNIYQSDIEPYEPFICKVEDDNYWLCVKLPSQDTVNAKDGYAIFSTSLDIGYFKIRDNPQSNQ